MWYIVLLFLGFGIIFYIVMPLYTQEMPMRYCPECESEDLDHFGDYIECHFCGAQFDLMDLDEEEELEEELEEEEEEE